MSSPQQLNYDHLAAQVLTPKKVPVQQVNRVPVQQVNRVPVQQVNRVPVQQATRNSYRNSQETHSQTQDERERKSENLISENQKYHIMAKTKCLEEELEKALHIISISTIKPKNIMAYLLTSAFFNGECILEPTFEEEQESKEERAAREERARVEAWAQGIAAKMQDSIASALLWFQNLPEETRARVETNILRTRPTLRDQFAGKKPFGPLVLVLLREERRKLEVRQ